MEALDDFARAAVNLVLVDAEIARLKREIERSQEERRIIREALREYGE